MADEKLTEQEALALIRGPRNIAEEDFDEDSVDMGDEDELPIELYEGGATNDAQAPAPETAPSSPEALEAQRRLEALEQENRRLRGEEDKRKAEDFRRRLNELPVEERADFVEKYYQEKERAQKMENMRLSMEKDFPLATALAGPVLSNFELEVEDPEAYREAMAELEQSYSAVIGQIVDQRVAAALAQNREAQAKQWDLAGLGGASPKPPSSVTPAMSAQQRYEEEQKRLLTDPHLTVESVQSMLRRRSVAKGAR